MKIVEKEKYFEEKTNSLLFNKKVQKSNDLFIRHLQIMTFYKLLVAHLDLSHEFNNNRQIQERQNDGNRIYNVFSIIRSLIVNI